MLKIKDGLGENVILKCNPPKHRKKQEGGSMQSLPLLLFYAPKGDAKNILLSYSLLITRLIEEVRHQRFKVVLGWINEKMK